MVIGMAGVFRAGRAEARPYRTIMNRRGSLLPVDSFHEYSIEMSGTNP